MKKKYLFIPEAKRWNSLIRKFINLHKRIKTGNSSEQQTLRISGKLQSIYKRLERMQYRVGIKLAGSVLALMLMSATSFSQDFTSIGNLTFTKDISVYAPSSPVYADIDGDSDLDLYVGNNSGYIQVFTNDGNGKFSVAGYLKADGAFIYVGSYAAPVFADIDGDSDLDLYVGERYGAIKVFINGGTGTFSAAPNLQADGVDIDVGNFSVPVFADIDGDSDLDLYVGEDGGAIKVFINDGTGNFSAAGNMQRVAGDIDVGDYAVPVFEDIDGDSDLDLYVGERYGAIKVFINDGRGTFSAAPDLQADGSAIDVGYAATPVFADIDGDNDLDLYIADNHGYINVFTNDGTGTFSAAGNLQADGSDINVGYFAAPVFADIDGDSDLDLYAGEYFGAIKVFINDGTGTFSAAPNLQADGSDIDVGYRAAPVFADIDGDNDLDLYVGEQYGAIKVFINDGTGIFNATDDLQADGSDIDIGNYAAPVFADIDGDNDLDLYVGENQGMIKVFINDGTGTFNTAADLQADGTDIDVGIFAVPVFADIDGDNDLDLYVGEYYGAIKVFINDGTGTFNAAADLQADGSDIDVGDFAVPVFADIDGDNDLDLYVGERYGAIKVFTND